MARLRLVGDLLFYLELVLQLIALVLVLRGEYDAVPYLIIIVIVLDSLRRLIDWRTADRDA